jgi:hypothetical protein
VPEDFEPKGGKERLAITAEYDTQALYGKVKASRDVLIIK